MAAVSVAHLSPDAGNVDVTVEGGTAYTAFAVGYAQPPETDSTRPLELVPAEDATWEVTLPSEDDDGHGMGEDEEMNETEEETGTPEEGGGTSPHSWHRNPNRHPHRPPSTDAIFRSFSPDP